MPTVMPVPTLFEAEQLLTALPPEFRVLPATPWWLERALLLDPTLGDPRVNGQAANNELLPIVRHRVYLRTVGGNPALFTPGSRR